MLFVTLLYPLATILCLLISCRTNCNYLIPSSVNQGASVAECTNDAMSADWFDRDTDARYVIWFYREPNDNCEWKYQTRVSTNNMRDVKSSLQKIMSNLLTLSAPCTNDAAPDKPGKVPKQPPRNIESAVTTLRKQKDDSGSAATTLPADDRCPIVVDTRTQLEWDEGHAPCAHRLEIQNDPGLVDTLETLVNGDRSHPVQVYCRSGNRSGKAQSILKGMGWTHVTNAGGWQSGQADAIKKLCDCKTRSKKPAKNRPVCKKCGTAKSGEATCCARGGDWFKKCGNAGDKKFAYTWDDGFVACKSKSITCLCFLQKLPFCPSQITLYPQQSRLSLRQPKTLWNSLKAALICQRSRLQCKQPAW